MTLTAQERAQRDRFDAFYTSARSPVLQAIERSVCGCDYGGNSWTTREEAHRIAALLDLKPGRRLLDVGAGSGWPALYLAAISGSDVALVDLPLTGLRIAADRAETDGIAGACWTALADAAALPFAAGSFHAVSHSDLLCCLHRKRAVLEACRRVIRDDGRMVFTVIFVTPGLSRAAHRRAVENGPEFIETELDYPTMLSRTAWRIDDCSDITADYAASCRRQVEADKTHSGALRTLLGAAVAAERSAAWRAKLAAINDGLLRRALFVATPLPAPAGA